MRLTILLLLVVVLLVSPHVYKSLAEVGKHCTDVSRFENMSRPVESLCKNAGTISQVVLYLISYKVPTFKPV